MKYKSTSIRSYRLQDEKTEEVEGALLSWHQRISEVATARLQVGWLHSPGSLNLIRRQESHHSLAKGVNLLGRQE